MNVELIAFTPGADALAGIAAATCTRSTNRKAALKHAIAGGHESVIEHASFTFCIEGVSRSLLAQLTRHRIASYSVESQRYCDMGEMPVVVPESIKKDADMLAEWESVLTRIRTFYRYAVEQGIPKEDARYITPQAAETNLILTMNARELKHFFALRCCNRAQWEIRALADRMLTLCKQFAPEIFRDAGPGCVRGECPEERPCGQPRTRDVW